MAETSRAIRRRPTGQRRTLGPGNLTGFGGRVTSGAAGRLTGAGGQRRVQAPRVRLARRAPPVLNMREQTSDSPRVIRRSQATTRTLMRGGYRSNPRDGAERLYRKG